MDGDKKDRNLGVGLDQSDADRETHEARYIVNFKPLHELASVCFNCFDAQVQALGNVLCRLPFGDELKNFTLAHAESRQRTRWPVRPFTVDLDGILRHSGSQVGFTLPTVLIANSSSASSAPFKR